MGLICRKTCESLVMWFPVCTLNCACNWWKFVLVKAVVFFRAQKHWSCNANVMVDVMCLFSMLSLQRLHVPLLLPIEDFDCLYLEVMICMFFISQVLNPHTFCRVDPHRMLSMYVNVNVLLTLICILRSFVCIGFACVISSCVFFAWWLSHITSLSCVWKGVTNVIVKWLHVCIVLHVLIFR